jgi:hypothetical protein
LSIGHVFSGYGSIPSMPVRSPEQCLREARCGIAAVLDTLWPIPQMMTEERASESCVGCNREDLGEARHDVVIISSSS